MRKLFYLIFFIILSTACSRNEKVLDELKSKTLSDSKFKELFLQLETDNLDRQDLIGVMQKDPDVKLYTNRVARNVEMTLNDNFNIFSENKDKILAAKKMGKSIDLLKSLKDKKGKSKYDYLKEQTQNYMIIYLKYVKLKKIPESEFLYALNQINATKKIDPIAIRNKFYKEFYHK